MFEAFFAVEVGGPFGPTSYRAGYRCGETGNAVCELELPAEIVETEILRDTTLTATVTPDGHIRFSLIGSSCRDRGDFVRSITEPIDGLIARFVSADSLQLEEVTSADLNSLLRRLFHSVALVQDAITHLSDQDIQGPT